MLKIIFYLRLYSKNGEYLRAYLWTLTKKTRQCLSHLILLVLASVRKTGDDSCDPTGRRNLAGIDHDQQLHQHVVNLLTPALYNEYILTPDRLAYFNAVNTVKKHAIQILLQKPLTCD